MYDAISQVDFCKVIQGSISITTLLGYALHALVIRLPRLHVDGFSESEYICYCCATKSCQYFHIYRSTYTCCIIAIITIVFRFLKMLLLVLVLSNVTIAILYLVPQLTV